MSNKLNIIMNSINGITANENGIARKHYAILFKNNRRVGHVHINRVKATSINAWGKKIYTKTLHAEVACITSAIKSCILRGEKSKKVV